MRIWSRVVRTVSLSLVILSLAGSFACSNDDATSSQAAYRLTWTNNFTHPVKILIEGQLVKWADYDDILGVGATKETFAFYPAGTWDATILGQGADLPVALREQIIVVDATHTSYKTIP